MVFSDVIPSQMVENRVSEAVFSASFGGGLGLEGQHFVF